MPLANLCAMAVGLLIAAIGVLGIASPSALLELGRALQSIGGVWLLGFVRIVCGAILLWAAPNARMPRVLIALGILIILFGLATPFIGIERSRAMFEWWKPSPAAPGMPNPSQTLNSVNAGVTYDF